MANSFIDPSLVRMSLPEGPGWQWNPGQTFVTAFNDAQENRRAQEKAAQEAELASILLPAKRAEAEFNIKKLALDSQLIEKLYKARSAALDGSYRGITSAIGATPDDSDTTAVGRFSPARYGIGAASRPAPPSTTPLSVKPKWSVVQPTPAGP